MPSKQPNSLRTRGAKKRATTPPSDMTTASPSRIIAQENHIREEGDNSESGLSDPNHDNGRRTAAQADTQKTNGSTTSTLTSPAASRSPTPMSDNAADMRRNEKAPARENTTLGGATKHAPPDDTTHSTTHGEKDSGASIPSGLKLPAAVKRHGHLRQREHAYLGHLEVPRPARLG